MYLYFNYKLFLLLLFILEKVFTTTFVASTLLHYQCMPATSNSVAAFSTTCSITIGIESHENFVTFEGKGIVGITKTINVSLPFLPYFGEKIKSGGPPYSF